MYVLQRYEHMFIFFFSLFCPDVHFKKSFNTGEPCYILAVLPHCLHSLWLNGITCKAFGILSFTEFKRNSLNKYCLCSMKQLIVCKEISLSRSIFISQHLKSRNMAKQFFNMRSTIEGNHKTYSCHDSAESHLDIWLDTECLTPLYRWRNPRFPDHEAIILEKDKSHQNTV